MNVQIQHSEVSKCVRCGACKALCPTYLTTLNETMGARGRIAILGEVESGRFSSSGKIADMIFSCMLCSACKNLCPAGINIPEAVYRARISLRGSYTKGRLIRFALSHYFLKMETMFSLLRYVQKLMPGALLKMLNIEHIPEIASTSFNKGIQVYKQKKKKGRVAIFAGCSVNYFYPHLGNALSDILFRRGYEVVVFSGEVCCGAPLRSLGLEEEAQHLAKRNIEHFSKVRAEAILSMCPTCTMVIRNHYPALAGDTIPNIMDVNEFFSKHGITEGLEIPQQTVTYHDPCHLNYAMDIKKEPRNILKNIKGIEFVEMNNADDCCGFAGLFSMQYKEISKNIGAKKIENIIDTKADTVVTSCPGCIMQLEALAAKAGSHINVKHIVEVVREAMNKSGEEGKLVS